MARRKSAQAPTFTSWEDVNEALRQIALAEIEISDIESEMDKQIIGIKKSTQIEAQPYLDRIKSIVKDIEFFTEEHKDELGKLKSKTFNFGEVGYRLTTSVILPKSKEKLDDIIRRLRMRKMLDCLNEKVTINKQALKKHGEDKAIEVGACWKQKDEFWCEAAKEKLPLCK